MKRVFVSYGRENTAEAKALAADFDDLGLDVWLDKDLTGGQAWWDQILMQIRECETFVLALSPESLASAACRREWEYALALGKRLLPVKVSDGISDDLLPPDLSGLHYVDYRQQDKAAIIQLMKALSGLPASRPLPDPLPAPPLAPISYLGGLREQIEASRALAFEEQTALLVKVKQGLREAKRDDVLQLIGSFRLRHDLFARVADEIDELLASLAVPAVESGPPVPSARTGSKTQGRGSVPLVAQASERHETARADRPVGTATESSAHEPVLRGIDELVDRVRVCFGPGGRSALVPQGAGEPVIVGRAIEVIRKFVPSNPVTGIGARTIQGAALAVHDIAGAGGATTALLAHAIYQGGLNALRGQRNPRKVIKAIEAATTACVDEMKQLAKACDKAAIDKLAASAARDEMAGRIVAEAFEKVGEGPVVIDEGPGFLDDLSVVEGASFDRGYLSAHFETDADRQMCQLRAPYILLCNFRLSRLDILLPILEKVATAKKPLLVVAEDVADEVLRTLIEHADRGVLACCAVKAPGFGDRRVAILEDLAILTDATLFASEGGKPLERATLADLGRAARVDVARESTIIVDAVGVSHRIEQRIGSIRESIEQTTSDYDKEKLQERLTRLAIGVAVISIGGGTKAERRDRTERFETALCAVRAALEEGVVPGGGHGLLRAADAARHRSKAEANGPGEEVLLRACQEPLRQLAINAGEDPDHVVAEVLKQEDRGYGFDPANGGYGDLFAAGVVDSSKSMRHALQTATAVGVQLLWSSLTP